MSKVPKVSLQLPSDSEWIIKRLADSAKDAKVRAESLYDEAHMPGLSNRAARAVKAKFAVESENVRKLNELIRHEQAMAYEEQLGKLGQVGFIAY